MTIAHVHVHIIPRYAGDMDDPTGGVRHVIPERGKYRFEIGHKTARTGVIEHFTLLAIEVGGSLKRQV